MCFLCASCNCHPQQSPAAPLLGRRLLLAAPAVALLYIQAQTRQPSATAEQPCQFLCWLPLLWVDVALYPLCVLCYHNK